MGAMSRQVPDNSPVDRRLEWTVAAAVALVLAVAAPLGLSSGDGADQVAQAFGMRRPFLTATSLADLLARIFALFPIGEAGVRAQGAGALACVLAMTLMVARSRLWVGKGGAPSMIVGVALCAVSRPFFETASAHPGTAVDLCLFVGIMQAIELVQRDPERRAAGLGLALLCGLATGGGWPLRVGTWPIAAAQAAWALRRGHRWPLLAPAVFIAGAGVVLAGVVVAPVGSATTLRMVLRQIAIPAFWGAPHPTGAREILAWVIDDAGVLGLLTATVGWGLAVRGSAQAAPVLLGWGLTIAAFLCTGDIFAVRLFVVASLASPVALAVTSFTATFGRARDAAVLLMAVILVLPPAVVGVRGILETPGRRDPALVARALDTAFDAHRPGTPVPVDSEAARWWRYGRAVGLSQPRLAFGRQGPR